MALSRSVWLNVGPLWWTAEPQENEKKFTGKERDSETGLDYFGARYYGNWYGRFLSADWSAKPEAVPYSDLHDPQSLNLYSYVRNIPTVKIDGGWPTFRFFSRR
jgi:RHS repeat-associated protein